MDVAVGSRLWAEGGWSGIDEGAQHVRHGGAGWGFGALQDQDWIGAGGRQRGGEPGQAAGEIFGREAEEGAKVFQSCGVAEGRCLRGWQSALGSSGAEMRGVL